MPNFGPSLALAVPIAISEIRPLLAEMLKDGE